jgi:hypothetical protein
MPEPALRVNRNILFKVFGDHQTVIQFEELFKIVDETNGGTSIDESIVLAGDDMAKANSLMAQLKDYLKQSFETVNENLKSYAKSFNYTGSRLDSVVYTFGSKTITKTLSYTGLQLISVVLSGSTPSRIDLTKTLTYSGLNLTGVTYT